MERVIIGPLDNPYCVLEDDKLMKVSTYLHSTLSGDQIEADQCIPIVYTTMDAVYEVYATRESKLYELSDNGVYVLKQYSELDALLESLEYGTELRYYNNSDLVGKFYVDSVVKQAKGTYAIKSVSAIGVLDKQVHVGGVYSMVPFDEAVREVVGPSFQCSFAADVASIKISNWLPYSTRRKNLHQILFAYGVVIHKAEDGNMHFCFPDADTYRAITSSNTFQGGSISNIAPASSIELIEHSFKNLSTDVEEVLFDNTDGSQQAANTTVVFQNAPVHDLRTSGALVIIESGVNYAIVSGVGVLYGKPYTHTTKSLLESTGIQTQEARMVTVAEAYMVNVTNSLNVMLRLKSYYSSAKRISHSIIYNGERTGDQFAIPDPFGGSAKAFLAKVELTSGNFLKARSEFIVGYEPTSGGNNYSNSQVFLEDGTFEVPEDVTSLLVVLIGGGQGGASGARGANGTRGALTGGSSNLTSGSYAYGEGGAGGAAGSGGAGGKVFISNLNVVPGETYQVSLGAGGAGGICSTTANTAGELGSPSTFGELSSESGVPSDSGYTDIFSGVTYALPGSLGKSRGGKGVGASGAGETIVVEGFEYKPGAQGATASRSGTSPDDVSWSGTAYGGLGGGPAHGSDGGNGTDGEADKNLGYGSIDPGSGGAGGKALYNGSDATVPGSGGSGGSGGGGGGGAGAGTHRYTAGMWPGSGGSGGLGSNGGAGAKGLCIVYY